MCVDNFSRIQYYLDFKEGYYYYIQILSRKKDNPNQRHVKVIRNFFVDDEKYLFALEDSIKDMCHFFNARAYIRLNIRSYRDTAMQQLKLLADYLTSRQYKSSRVSFSRAAGRYNAQENPLWIIDFDGNRKDMIQDVESKIRELQKEIKKDYNLYGTVPTPNGIHLISNPFNLKEFKKDFPDIDVKKDNPTILYAAV